MFVSVPRFALCFLSKVLVGHELWGCALLAMRALLTLCACFPALLLWKCVELSSKGGKLGDRNSSENSETLIPAASVPCPFVNR